MKSNELKKVDIQLTEMYNRMGDIALAEVERLARIILRKNPSLKEFVNAMGVCFFTTHDGYIVDLYEYGTGTLTRKSFKELAYLIDEWDSILKLTGESMRFTATGDKITDW